MCVLFLGTIQDGSTLTLDASEPRHYCCGSSVRGRRTSNRSASNSSSFKRRDWLLRAQQEMFDVLDGIGL